MKAIGVIPARLASTRLEAKVLQDIHGQPMIQHVWARAKQSRLLADVIIACDDEKVRKAAEKFGAKAVMTSPRHPSGTDRIAEVVRNLAVEVVVNIQGDEPLIHQETIDLVAQTLLKDQKCQMSTAIKILDRSEDLIDPNIVKVVIDHKGQALYFSRSAIPFNRDQRPFEKMRYYKHFGIYGYRKEFLMKIKDLPASDLEESEKLEQLRVLAAGYRIKTVVTPHDTVSVDTLQDLERVRKIIGKNKP
jgi:3-deoxy-manno-octulosonate cytidylyltransferase (CMP-KDO synthetase)